MIYERFFEKLSTRFIILSFGVGLTAGYYFMIDSVSQNSPELWIRTIVTLIMLLVAFIWFPVIKSKISFNESFMVVFKSFFHSALYAGVLFGGCSLIIAAINSLIVNVGTKVFAHSANIIFILFAPIFFLSLIPFYWNEKDKSMSSEQEHEPDESVQKAAYCPRFLEILISYIIIPLTAAFTAILFVYIIRNITGEFWTNNLLEPMIVSYSITVILVYILSSRIENQVARLYRLIFPKVLIPIVLFQLVSSFISISHEGVTHTRYFVILFGLFAVCSGIVMSVVPVRKNGMIAALLIAFCALSILPPVDAFTISYRSQENSLKNVLIQNGMLKNNKIIPNSSISESDKKRIVMSVQYLDMMKYTEKINWFPSDFTFYEDFYNTFGFHEYLQTENVKKPINLFLNPNTAIDIAEYDVLAYTTINNNENGEVQVSQFNKSGKNYVIKKEKIGNQLNIVLLNQNNQEIIRYNVDEIFSRYRDYTADKSELSAKEATFLFENKTAKITLVVRSANVEAFGDVPNYFAEFYILIRMKE